MTREEVNSRKALIRGLRKALESVIDKEWPTDQTKSKVHDLLDHIGRSGEPIEDRLIAGPGAKGS